MIKIYTDKQVDSMILAAYQGGRNDSIELAKIIIDGITKEMKDRLQKATDEIDRLKREVEKQKVYRDGYRVQLVLKNKRKKIQNDN